MTIQLLNWLYKTQKLGKHVVFTSFLDVIYNCGHFSRLFFFLACQDKSKYCQFFKARCGETIVKFQCPRTCGNCGGGCKYFNLDVILLFVDGYAQPAHNVIPTSIQRSQRPNNVVSTLKQRPDQEI